MFSRLSGPVLAIALVTLPFTATAQDQQSVLAAWSQILGEVDVTKAGQITPPSLQMRWVLDGGGDCGAFSVSDAAPGQGGSVIDLDAQDNQWADQPFDKVTCFFDIPESWTEAYLIQNGAMAVLTSQISYSDASGDPKDWTWQDGPSDGAEIIVKGPAWIGSRDTLNLLSIGDTGCRGVPAAASSRQQQNCDNTAGRGDWPLQLLSEAAASEPADLVIHVGDYRYYYEDVITQDSWDLWQKDFFPAAQPLMLAAPWVFVRGNHEGCPGADLPFGLGYFQFFGTTAAGADCSALTDAGASYMLPWFFDIGSGTDAHRFVVLDVSSWSYQTGADVPELTKDFETAMQMTADGPDSVWWTYHTPGVQLIYYSSDEHTGEPGVTEALLKATGDGTLLEDRFCGHDGTHACKPSQFLMGHQHLYQNVTFPEPGETWTFPRQMIVGHGGTKVDTADPAPSGDTCHYSHFPIGSNGGDVTGYANTDETHGLVYWTRDPGAQAGWTGEQIFAPDPGNLVPIAVDDAGQAPACFLD